MQELLNSFSNEIIIAFLVGIIIGIIKCNISSFIISRFRKKETKPPIVPIKNNFENDITFLDFLLTEEVKKIKTFKLSAYTKKTISKDIIFDDKILETLVYESTKDILILLSDNYKETLKGYFKSEEEITKFITERLYYSISEMVMNTNKSHIKKIYGNNDK